VRFLNIATRKDLQCKQTTCNDCSIFTACNDCSIFHTLQCLLSVNRPRILGAGNEIHCTGTSFYSWHKLLLETEITIFCHVFCKLKALGLVLGYVGHSVDARTRGYVGHSVDARTKGYVGHSVDARTKLYVGHSVDARTRGYVGHPVDARTKDQSYLERKGYNF
jgi:hypothetical protein